MTKLTALVITVLTAALTAACMTGILIWVWQ